MSQKTFVVDTNVLIDYPDVVPDINGKIKEINNPTVDLSDALIIIPTTVIRELSSFKREKNDRGKASRLVLRRLRELFCTDNDGGLLECYGPKNVCVKVEATGQTFMILPIHKDFRRSLPFSPSETDMDGQIILTTISAIMKKHGIVVDGTSTLDQVINLSSDDIMLLTNDNGLAIRARTRGIATSRFGYHLPKPYTGRRDLKVPKDLLLDFIANHRISRQDWEAAMPKEAPLVANEFIIMKTDEADNYVVEMDYESNAYYENIGRYDVEEDAIMRLECVRNAELRPMNAGQAIYMEAILNDKFSAVVCDGPAGSGKTFISTILGYQECLSGKYIGITVVPCESRSNYGALPGDLDEKMDPEVQPFKNALRNYFIKNDPTISKKLKNLKKFGPNDDCSSKGDNGKTDKESKNKSIRDSLNDRVELVWKNWFANVPIENARGRDFTYELALYDEFQDQNQSQADTLIKRIGEDGKIIITGDVNQIHAPYLDEWNNGLVYASTLLYDNPMVARVSFTEDEVVRHPLVKAITRKQKNERKVVPSEIIT